MNEIPDWFNLENYTQPMSPELWAAHIAPRSTLVLNNKFQTEEIHKNRFYRLIERHPSIGNDRSFNLYQSMLRKEQRNNRAPLALTSHSPNEILEAYADRSTSTEEYFLGTFDNNNLTNVEEWIRINFDFTELEIIQAFTDYVRQKRKADQIKMFQRPILSYLNEWYVFRLIALFDLLYWREITDRKLTYSKIGAAIWPTEDLEREQRIRKKGKDLIFKVFRKSTTLQLAREIPEQDPISARLEGARAVQEYFNK